MIEFIKQYWLQFIFGGVVSILSISVKYLFNSLKKEQKDRNKKVEEESKEQELLKEGVLALLHDRIYQSCQYHIHNDSITVQDLNNLEYLYRGYRGLCGNGTGEELYKRCKSLRILPTESVQSEDAV